MHILPRFGGAYPCIHFIIKHWRLYYELHRKKLKDVTVKFKYSIRVINEGDIEGYAKEVTDYIPEGLKFVASDNPGWTDKGNNVITTRLLENTLLKTRRICRC